MFPAMGKNVKRKNAPVWGTTETCEKGNVPAMGNRIKELREAKGWTLSQLAEVSGISRGQIIKLERGDRRLNADNQPILAAAFGIRVGELHDDLPETPVVAYVIDKGGPTLSFTPPFDGFGVAPNPAGAKPNTVAAIVKGEGLRGWARDGWAIFFENEFPKLDDTTLGELCVLLLPDGSKIVRTPFEGRLTRHFDLEADGEPTLRDVSVLGGSRVTWIVTAKSLERESRIVKRSKWSRAEK